MPERNYVTEERLEKERLKDLKEVEHPDHYTFGTQQVWDTLDEWFPNDPHLWLVGKYIARANHKGNLLKDLRKARQYLDRRILKEENKIVKEFDPRN